MKEIKDNLREKISTAKFHALNNDENAEIIRAERLAFDEMRQDDAIRLGNILSASTVTVTTLWEFKFVLEQIFSRKDQVDHMLSHENAHGNMAEIVGATHTGYCICFSKGPKGFIFNIYTELWYPESWRDKNLDLKIKIYGAPGEYGNTISNSDFERIEKLKKQLQSTRV